MKMETKRMNVCRLSLTAGGLVFMAGCVVPPEWQVETARPTVVVAEPVMVPASYVVVDGDYYGWSGGSYFYLGVGGWMPCDSMRLARFHRWERSHRDWREHAIPNDHFRRDAQGHDYPRHDDRRFQPSHNDSRFQPSHNDSRFQPSHNDPRVQPSHNDPRVQPSHNDPRVQPSHNDPRVQPDSGKPTTAVPEKK